MNESASGTRPKLAIFGGSFDPPHLGHLILAEQIRDQFQIDRLIWMPGYLPPHKQDYALASPQNRLAMVTIAIASNPGFEVSDLEIDRKGISFTVDTLEEISSQYPESELFLIVGADSFVGMDTWYLPDRIRELAKLIVYGRKGSDLTRNEDGDILFADGPDIDISSTLVRNAMRSGRSIRYLVTDEVRHYIAENKLYI